MRSRGNIKRKMTHTQMIMLGFLLILLAGTILLMFPFATKPGESTDWLGALFTATSATCVTGLVAYDTFTHFTVFGQLVILAMIQVGGLGFLTIGVLFSLLLNRKISLSTRGLLQDSLNMMQVGGIVRMIRGIIKGTIIIEAIGAVLLSIRFIPQMGIGKGIYYSIFHSVSAFCNAGFDLFGYKGEFSSLVTYSSDWLVNMVIMGLIIVGGIGFFVWSDIVKNKWHFRSYRLHTKIVLTVTAVLLVGGTIVFYFLEDSGAFAGMSFSDKILASMFSSVTARTAGFNTVDTGALTTASKLFTMLLMLIGGSPGSTAGGIKTVTIAVLLCYVWSNLRNAKGCNIFGRRLDDESIKKSSNVLIISLLLVCIGVFVICLNEKLPTEDIMFEVFSAIGTVGMTTGITRSLCTISRIILIILMYCGRIGSMSFALSFTERKQVAPVQQPVEKVMIG